MILPMPRVSTTTTTTGTTATSMSTFLRVVLKVLFVLSLSLSSSSSSSSSVLVLAFAASSPSSSIKVAVIGCTGRLGRETVDQLIQQGIPVKCLVRPSTKIPEEWTTTTTPPAVEVVVGNIVGDDNDCKSTLRNLLTDCTHCVALYGATRKSKLSDIWTPDVEDTDVTHSKQVNYKSIQTLVDVCAEDTSTCKHIVRITGKGEDPTSFFSVLINMFGSMAKGWNYEGETVLRNTNTNDIGYTIIRPGIMRPSDDVNLDGDGTDTHPPQHLQLADNGGNDLKVSAVSYHQIAQLVVACCTTTSSSPVQQERRRVTLSAMNVPGKATTSVEDQLRSLNQDTRVFPPTLIEQHKAAVRRVVKIIAAISTGMIAILVGSIIKMVS